jgi:cell division protein FtsL
MQMKKRGLRFKNIFLFVFIVYAVATIINQQLHIAELKTEEQAAAKKIEAVQKDNARLEEMINNATSPEYIERMAREQLGLVKAGERVYIDQSTADNNIQNRDN